ncbi:uncharacterized protein ISCGN_006115, partial [Ixodes scapularis]
YHVVEFLADSSTYAVPDWWLEKSENLLWCHWPPYTTKLEIVNAVRRNEAITPDWKALRVKIIHSY